VGRGQREGRKKRKERRPQYRKKLKSPYEEALEADMCSIDMRKSRQREGR